VPCRGAPDRTRPAWDAGLPASPRAAPGDPPGSVKVGFRFGCGAAGAPGWPSSATEQRDWPDRSSQPTHGRSPPGRRAAFRRPRARSAWERESPLLLAGRASMPDRTRPAWDAGLPASPRAAPGDPRGSVKVGFRFGCGAAGAPGWPSSATEQRDWPDRSSQPTHGRSPPGRRAPPSFSGSGFHYNTPNGVRPTEHDWPGMPAYPHRLGQTPVIGAGGARARRPIESMCILVGGWFVGGILVVL